VIYHVIAGASLAVLILNGLRVVIGVPPIAYWFRSRRCPLCEGVGWLTAHTHTGEVMRMHVEDAVKKLAVEERRQECP
jgi:hypothetical protein